MNCWVEKVRRIGLSSIPFIFACALIVVFVGCGGGSSSSNENGDDQPYTLTFAAINYRNFENPADNFVGGYAGIANNGSVVQATDIVDSWLTDSDGFDVLADEDGFGVDRFYWYECRGGGACTQSSLVEESSLWARFNFLPAHTYRLNIQMANGYVLTDQIDYNGELHLPFIPSATMQSQWVSGDLVLSWTNPTTEPNWDQVTLIRVVIKTTTGPGVILINLDPADETVIIPASLVADAEGLGLGALSEWRVETRVYDTQDRNYARAVSEIIPLATP
jgi:hypothetical protein